MPHPLMLIVIIHKDLSDHDFDDIYENHFKWLREEFETLSGRTFAMIFVQPSDGRNLSDHSYKLGTPGHSLYSWQQKVEEYLNSIPDDSYDDHTRKFLLLTRDNLSSTIAGIAAQTGNCAIASINSNQTPAHEVGHMFGAEHEDFEVYYNGWWDETIMASGSLVSSLRGNAKRFSDRNRENIRKYLEEHA